MSVSKLDIILEALRSKKTLAFDYDDKPRIVEVHAVGMSSKQSLVMRGWQVAGESSRNALPSWSLFTVAKMENIELGFLDSQAPAPGYKMNDSHIPGMIEQVEVLENA